MDIDSVLSSWDGENCLLHHDAQSGVWFVIAIHSTRSGAAAGGTRVMHYASAADAVADATSLASAMTLKMGVADLPMGGGKSVIALPPGAARPDSAAWSRLMEIHAGNLERLSGQYWTGPDVGTTSADMDSLGSRTRYVFGRSLAAGGAGSSAGETASRGLEAVLATAAEAGLGGVRGRTLLVQGLGAVGFRVAGLAANAGARLLVADVDPQRCVDAARLGARVVGVDEVTITGCDILVPCATGGLVDARVARELPCAAVAGAANNVLTSLEVADVLRDRGILYAPDFVANCGGAIHLVGREVLDWSPEKVRDRTEQIRSTLSEIFASARSRGISTESAARELAREKLESAARSGTREAV